MERFWEGSQWIEYLLNSRFTNIYTDHSFYFKGQYVPLLQSGDEFYSPGFADDKHLLAEIKQKAQKLNIKRIQVDSQIKSYLNISSYTCILDLNDVKPSKGHKSAIKKAEQHLKCYEYDKVDLFMVEYFRIAGKQTRPVRTFEILDEWIKKGFGTLLVAKFMDIRAGYAYVFHWKDYSYYFMACIDPNFKAYNVSHFLQENTFSLLRQKGIRYYELGDQPQNGLYECPSEKEKNIALFKRNFGGQVVVKPKSEYFFCPEYLRETYQNRINNYIGAEYGN